MSTIEPSTASLLSAALWQKTSDSGPISASEVIESSFSDVEISEWAPTIAIADTFSDAAASVAIVTLSAGSLDGLASILLQMKAATEDATEASRVGSSQDYTQAIDVLSRLEQDISQFIGSNLASPETFTTSMVESQEGGFQSRFFQVLDMSEVEGFDSLASLEVDMAAVMTSAHDASTCPICQASSQADGLSDALTMAADGGVGLTTLDSDATSESSSINGVYSDAAQTTRDNAGSDVDTSADSGTSYIDPLVQGNFWDLAAAETLTYSYYQSDAVVDYADYVNTYGQPDYPSAAAAFNATQQTEMNAVYDLWSTYAPFNFEEVTESSIGSVVGDLRVAYMTNPGLKSSAAAFAYYPYENAIGGDTWYIVEGAQNSANNASYAPNLTFTDNTYGRYTALHEIGHSIGLSHPFDGGSQSGQTLTGNGLEDDMRYTVMSYENTAANTIYYQSGGSLTSTQIYVNTPMIYDVAAVEFLYGEITDSNLGDTTYSITDHQQMSTIVDSGGTDTIDLSATEFRSIVDLTPGSLSSVGYATEAEQEAYWATQGYSLAAVESYITAVDLFTGEDNLGIAFSATIENVVGSAGDDEITGNDANNRITGNAGDDTIAGGSGDDTAIFAGNFSDYSVTTSTTGVTTVVDNNSSDGDEGSDRLTGVEFLEFADLTYTVSTDFGGRAYRRPEEDGEDKQWAPPHTITGMNLQSLDDAEEALTLIDIAIDQVLKQRAELGSVENRLLRTVSSLSTEVLNLSQAKSQIMSADYAKEAATLAKHQIVQMAGLEMLKLSQNFSRQVTQLLR